MKKDTTLRNSLLLLLAATVWGFAFVAQSVGMDYVGPFTFNGSRNLLGCIVLLPVIAFNSRKKKDALLSENGDRKSQDGTFVSANKESEYDNEAARAAKEERKTLLKAGLLCGTILFFAGSSQQIGLQYTTVGKAGFLTACYIILVPIIGLFMKKKCGPFLWIAVALAMGGLYLLCITESFTIQRGDILEIFGAVLFSVHILVIDYYSPKVDGIRLSCMQFIVCFAWSLVAALLTETISLSGIWEARVAIFYAGAISCGLGYTLQIVGQKDLNPTVASLIMSLESSISVLAGWLLLGERLSTREFLGCVLMVVAIVLAQLPERKA